MKSPQCCGLLGRRPSQERNELIVTLRLLLSISELSTAVDRRCPGPRPSITGPHHQETKPITVSQMWSPESDRVQQNNPTQTQLNFGITAEVSSSCRRTTRRGQRFSGAWGLHADPVGASQVTRADRNEWTHCSVRMETFKCALPRQQQTTRTKAAECCPLRFDTLRAHTF